jgi:hypothetical protein
MTALRARRASAAVAQSMIAIDATSIALTTDRNVRGFDQSTMLRLPVTLVT